VHLVQTKEWVFPWWTWVGGHPRCMGKAGMCYGAAAGIATATAGSASQRCSWFCRTRLKTSSEKLPQVTVYSGIVTNSFSLLE
jgi:hypothetical protein